MIAEPLTIRRWPAALVRLALALTLVLSGAPSLLAQSPAAARSHPALGSGGVNRRAQQGKPYVVMISFDGFRADYLDSLRPPNFARLMQRGARARGLIPVFPSKTFPNHYSIVTGLYAEHHGIVANAFYDPARRARYAIADTSAVRDGSWYRGEPLWVTAERQGMVAASFFWPGSEAAIGGVRPTIVNRYDGTVPDSARVDTVLAWLRRPPAVRPHLVTLYASDVDDAGHKFGPGTRQVADAVGAVDRMLGRLIDGLDSLSIRDSVYLIVVSDHGMARYTPTDFATLGELVDTTGVRIADAGPNANLHVSGGEARARAVRDSLNRVLPHGRAYLREEVPARLHYRSDPRIGDVVIILDAPFQVSTTAKRPSSAGGAHGWDPRYPAMHGIFLVAGPGVRRGVELPRVANVDIYPFVTELLQLRPAAKIDGASGRIRGLVMRTARKPGSALRAR
jgi:predicted AlkP superfamily pyrophosphatase or phosphodiesterase